MNKKVFYLMVLTVISVIIILTGCSKKNNNNLIITNKSSEAINSLAIQRVNQTDVLDSKFEPNEKGYFDMGVQNNCTFVVEFEDTNKQVIRSNQITADFKYNKDEVKKIRISKDDNKKWSITLEN